MNVGNLKTMRLKVERVIEASPAQVYDAWLDPGSPGSPWNGMTRTILQPVVDGLFYRMHMSDGDEFELAHYGRFIVLDRPRQIKHTWVSQHTQGLESIVTITLEQSGESTQVVLIHENLPDDKMGRLHKQGWDYYLAELADGLSTAPARASRRSRS